MFCSQRFLTIQNRTFQGVNNAFGRFSPSLNIFSAFFLTLVIIVGSSKYAQAEVTIDLPNEVKITFASGNFDVKSYSGKMEGVKLFHEDELVITAKTFELESNGGPVDGKFEVKRLYMSEAALALENVTAESVLIRNIDLLAFRNADEAASFDDGLTDGSAVVVSGVEFAAESAVLNIAAFETLEFKFKTLPNGSRFAERSGFRVDGFTISPTSVSEDARPYVNILADNGISALSMDFVSAQETELVLGELYSEYTIGLNVQDLADLKLKAKLRTQLETFGKLLALGVGQNGDDADVFTLLGEVALEAVNLDYEDYGLVDLSMELASIADGLSVEDVRADVQSNIAERVGDTFPRNGDKIVIPVTSLLNNGGGLRVRVAPKSPIPLANMLGFMIIPDLALDQLNVRVAHLPQQ